LTEALKQPARYVTTGIIELSARIGGLFALITAYISTYLGMNWRLAFWVGAGIALVGLAARIRLKETPEFVDFKHNIALLKKRNTIPQNHEKLDKRTIASYFIIQVACSISIYISFVYSSGFMKRSLGMTPEEIIGQNLRVTLFTIIATSAVTLFVKKYHPLKIAKLHIMLFAISLPFVPYWLGNISSLASLLLFQLTMGLLALNPFCLQIPCFGHIPIWGRFTVLATTFGAGNALANILATFSLTPLTSYFGYYGLWFILMPVAGAALYGINHVINLEINKGDYHNYPDSVQLKQL
jgi:predicted MFS family arabinose efflux permease